MHSVELYLITVVRDPYRALFLTFTLRGVVCVVCGTELSDVDEILERADVLQLLKITVIDKPTPRRCYFSLNTVCN